MDILSRTGYGASNAIREFSNEYAGNTPDIKDPLAAFWRGIKGEERSTGKEIWEDVGLSGTKGVFGGESKWYNPSPAGALGLATDIVNPLDPLNWVGFGQGDDIIKGGSKGTKALTEAFGTKGGQIADIIKVATGAADKLDDLGAENIGKLSAQILNKVDNPDTLLKQVSELIKGGLAETGLKATSKLDYRVMKPLSVGLQNPFKHY